MIDPLGLPFFILITFIQGLWVFSRIGSNIWLAYWTEQSALNPEDDRSFFYLEIYSSFTILFGVTAFLRSFLISKNNGNFA